MTTEKVFLTLASQAAMFMILIAMVILLWRMARGPVTADRIIAMDLMSVLVVAFLVILSIHTGKTTYLDVAIAYACIAFLGTIALVRFMDRSGGGKTDLKSPHSRPNRTKGGSE